MIKILIIRDSSRVEASRVRRRVSETMAEWLLFAFLWLWMPFFWPNDIGCGKEEKEDLVFSLLFAFYGDE